MNNTNATTATKNQSTKAINFNPFQKSFHNYPYEIYDLLRNQEPVHWSFIGVWVLTRYADVKAVLTDKRFATDSLPKRLEEKNKYAQNHQGGLTTLQQATSKFLFYMNPPDHTRLRGLVSKAFSPSFVESLRPKIQKTVGKLLGKVQDAGCMDIITDLAAPLPVTVIANLLGMPIEDCDILHEWSTKLSRVLDPLISIKEYEHLNSVAQQFENYIHSLIAEREKRPQDDLISGLIAARDQGDKLRADELSTVCMQLFITGEETTVNTIGNGMLALLNHPEQFAKLKAEPRLINCAVEELLRYDSPVQFTGRYATEDIEIDGKLIKKGDRVLLGLGAGNHDPNQFDRPTKLDITRQENRHLAFADGIHYCLGAVLARAQAQIAIAAMVQNLDSLKLNTENLVWRKNIYLRGLMSLPVIFITK
jgi:pimeloyl-[acyl-carrier protein] synthase